MNARRALAAAADALCAAFVTALAATVLTVTLAMAAVDHASHAPAVSRPADGTSYATTHVCGAKGSPV